MVKRLAEKPVVVATDSWVALRTGLSLGLVLGFASGQIVAVALYTYSELGRTQSLLAGGIFALLCAVVIGVWSWRGSRGFAYVANGEGFGLTRFGQPVWFAPWESFRIESYGLFGRRKRVVLPDGRRVTMGWVTPGSRQSMREIRSILETFEVTPRLPKKTWQLPILCAAIGAGLGIPLAVLGMRRLDALADDTNRFVSPSFAEYAPGLGMLAIGVIAISSAFFCLLPLVERLEKNSERAKGSDHGPLWVDYKRQHLQVVPAVEMVEGKKYRYLDPRRLKEHRQNGIGIAIALGFFFAVTWIPPANPEDFKVMWIVRGAMFLLMFVPIKLIQSDKRMRDTLTDTFWIDGGRLYTQRGARVASFSSVPVRTAKGDPEDGMSKFMAWWEEYENECGKYRLDRRFLWPLDDES